jgi:hypothetical protein
MPKVGGISTGVERTDLPAGAGANIDETTTSRETTGD